MLYIPVHPRSPGGPSVPGFPVSHSLDSFFHVIGGVLMKYLSPFTRCFYRSMEDLKTNLEQSKKDKSNIIYLRDTINFMLSIRKHQYFSVKR